MKTYRANEGPFSERPYYDIKDVELVCTQELQSSNLYPDTPSPIRIDRFIEKRFGIVPEYDDLEESILGYTCFGEQGVEQIVLSRSLDTDASDIAKRRIRTTIAHEAGHGLLHSHLFVLGSEKQPVFSFASDMNRNKILCREILSLTRETSSYDGRWWEYQANCAMGALLLPKMLVVKTLEPFLHTQGVFREKVFNWQFEEQAISQLSNVFDVNQIVARIRLEGLYKKGDEKQLKL